MNKKRSYWVLFSVMVLVGALLMVFVGSQNQLPVVPDVNAQGMSNYGFTIPYNLSTPGYTFPGDIIFAGAMSPGDIIFNAKSPSDGNRSGSSSLTTLMTCYGCGQTTSTCGWDCGPTFLLCTGSVCGGSGSNTQLFCPTSMNCGGQKSFYWTGSICPGQYATLPLIAQDIEYREAMKAKKYSRRETMSGCGITYGDCGMTYGGYGCGSMAVCGIGSMAVCGIGGSTYGGGCGGMTYGGGCGTSFCGMSLGGYQSQFLGTAYHGISDYTSTPAW